VSGPGLGRAATVAALLAAAASAAAFVRSTTGANPGTGQALWWRARQVNFIVNASGYRGGCASPGDAAAAVRASFPTWGSAARTGAQPCTDFTFHDCGDSSRTDLGYAQGASDNANLVVFRSGRCIDHAGDPACSDPTSASCVEKFNCWSHDNTIGGGGTLALTTVTFDVGTGEIFDADMELHGWDGSLTTPTGFYFTCASAPPCVSNYGGTNCAEIDVQNTVTHEAGHMLGLDHVCVSGGTPPSDQCPTTGNEPTMAPTAGAGDIDKRTLEQDDVSGVCSVYPAGGPTQRATGSPTGDNPTATVPVAAAAACPPLVKSSTGGGGGGGCATGGAGGLGLVALALVALRRRLARP